MKRRHFRVRGWIGANDCDLPVYEWRVVDGRIQRVKIPEKNCFVIERTSNGDCCYAALHWLPESLRPPVDADQWAEEALKVLSKKFKERELIAKRIKLRGAA